MSAAALQAHLDAGVTDIARCWKLTRSDGVTLGFTDHDRDLAFEGVVFKAETGLTAKALSQTTGLAVDNTEALGALSDAAITEADLAAGRFDGAVVEAWLVRWSDPMARALTFRGTLGEITRQGGAFEAELRGLSEALNRPTGRVYHKSCSNILGEGGCGVDLSDPNFTVDVALVDTPDARVFAFEGLDSFAEGWFQFGTLTILDGAAAGLLGPIKNDRTDGATRWIELWAPLGARPTSGATVRLVAGCDKTFETCRTKFGDAADFRGFPDIPGDDWVLAHPSRAWVLNGGSRR
ncbi:MAG: DUF2163 domain-containing protein [Pseudomonadota bacterium]